MAGLIGRSRLRSRLALQFGTAFLICLVGLDVTLYFYLHTRAQRRLHGQLVTAGAAFLSGIRSQLADAHLPLAINVENALRRWPVGPEAFAFFDASNHLIGYRASHELAAFVTAGRPAAAGPIWDAPSAGQQAVRLAEVSDTVGGELLRVVVARSNADLHDYDSALLGWLGGSIPVVILVAVIAGYGLAANALRPLAAISRSIADIDPAELSHRLPVGQPPDELDVLADQFNRLLERLSEAQSRYRLFLAQAAHQLKTPLTIVRGESALGLERSRDLAEYQACLQRIQRAAEQMSHRVEGLFLLAHAQAGERPPMNDTVELDGLALECADLMRRRAHVLDRTLNLERIEQVQVPGNEGLIREALLELIENALRHGDPRVPVAVSVRRSDGHASTEVLSAGPAPDPAILEVARGPLLSKSGNGLGLSIVHWIAEMHGGSLRYTRRDDRNLFAVEWPTAPRPDLQ